MVANRGEIAGMASLNFISLSMILMLFSSDHENLEENGDSVSRYLL